MRRRIMLLMTTAVVVSTMFAVPAADAGTAKRCDKQRDGKEVRCCIKRSDSPAEERRCIQRNV